MIIARVTLPAKSAIEERIASSQQTLIGDLRCLQARRWRRYVRTELVIRYDAIIVGTVANSERLRSCACDRLLDSGAESIHVCNNL